MKPNEDVVQRLGLASVVVTDVEVTDSYIQDAVDAAYRVANHSPTGSEERDVAEYLLTIVQEVYRQRGRVAFLEGWKEATEAAVEHTKRA